jgi:hypothetical protein
VAVALGGQGRYAAASAVLQGLLADPRVPTAVAAHAAVTLAAHRRQLGGHAAARRYDALGLRLAVAAVPDRGAPDTDGTDPRAARVDALVGLAADALGIGALDTAGHLLDAADHAARDHPSWRPFVRAGWVRAELALVRGAAVDAVAPAGSALHAAAGSGSVRHVLKSRIVLAVARSAGGADPTAAAAAVGELDAAAVEADRLGLLPLSWPARLAAADLLDRFPGIAAQSPMTMSGTNDTATWASRESVRDTLSDAARRRHAAAATLSVIEHRSDPVGRRLMGDSVWLPQRLPVM